MILTLKATRARKLLLLMSSFLLAIPTLGSEEPTVRVEPTDSVGPRALEKQTEDAVVRGYLQAWQTMRQALAENRTDSLDKGFVGVAKQRLADTVQDQQKIGIRTRYQDHSHHLTLLFYSPEGLSVQLADNVDYDVQLVDHGEVKATERVHTRYIAVMTPTEVRWQVRFFQAEPQ